MINEFVKKLKDIKNIEKDILKIMYKGFNYCFLLTIISSLVLLYYILNPVSYIIYDCGIILFKTSLLFFVFFFISGIITNNVKKELYKK